MYGAGGAEIQTRVSAAREEQQKHVREWSAGANKNGEPEIASEN